MKTNLILIFLTIVILTSCSTTDNCPAGYTGVNCDTKFNSIYVGTYYCTQTGPVSGTNSYTIVLNPDTDIVFQFRISNLGNLGFSNIITPVIYSDDYHKFSAVKQALGTSGYDVEIMNGVSNNYGNNITADYSFYSGSTFLEERHIVLTK